MPWKPCLFLIAQACLFQARLWAAGAPDDFQRSAVAARLTGARPVIDGRPYDAAWLSQTAGPAGLQPGAAAQKLDPSRQIRFKIAYDRDYLYALVVCPAHPDSVRRIFSSHDQPAGDLVTLSIDPHSTRPGACVFSLTAAGVKSDAFDREGEGDLDYGWNPGWEGAAALLDSGWAAEFKIPFDQLPNRKAGDQDWGLKIERRSGDSVSEKSGALRGLVGIAPSHRVELRPSFTLAWEQDDGDIASVRGDDGFSREAGGEAGLDIGPRFRLDAAVNPDFGEVEEDTSELNLSAYETFHGENRPFFLAGGDSSDFSTGDIADNNGLLFHSRRIGDALERPPILAHGEEYRPHEFSRILGAFRFSGKTERGLDVGIVSAVTGPEGVEIHTLDSTGDISASRHATVDPLTHYLAARIGKKSPDGNASVAAVFTSVARRLDDADLKADLVSAAHAGGLALTATSEDGAYLSAKAFGSLLTGSRKAVARRQQSPLHAFGRPRAPHLRFDSTLTSLSGAGGFLEAGRQTDFFQCWAKSSALSPGLDFNDLGYLKETDRAAQEIGVSVNRDEPWGPFLTLKGNLVAAAAWSFGLEHTLGRLESEFSGDLPHGWEAGGSVAEVFPALDTRMLRGGPALLQDRRSEVSAFFDTDLSRSLSLETQAFVGFNPAIAYRSQFYALKISAEPTERLRLTVDADGVIDDLPFEYLPVTLPENVFLVGRLRQDLAEVSLKIEYHITPEMSLQYSETSEISAMDYSDFKSVADGKAAGTAQRFHPLGAEAAFDAEADTFRIQSPGRAAYEFENPDESYADFQSRLAFTWEFAPGSSLYLVWSHRHGHLDNVDRPRLGEAPSEPYNRYSRDAAVAKISCGFGL